VLSLKAVSREEYFWQKEVETALKAIKVNKNIIVRSLSKTGKTTFLIALSERINAEKNRHIIPLIFSAKNCFDTGSYIRKNLKEILKAHPDIFGKSPEKLFELQITEIGKKISEIKAGKETKEILTFLLLSEKQPQNAEETIKKVFQLLTSLSKETKTKTVVMVDDADRLNGIKSNRNEDEKKKISMAYFLELIEKQEEENKKGALFVLTTSSQTGPEIKNAEHIELKQFSIEDTQKFLFLHNIKTDEATLNLIYNFTGGIPFYINFLGRTLSTRSERTTTSVSRLIDDVLSNEFNEIFSEKIKQLSPKELLILFCMAEHKVNTPSRISRLLNYSQTNVRRFLSIMEEKGFVTLKERGVFEIHDPMFRKWLEKESESH
jgi:hypothetical protein